MRLFETADIDIEEVRLIYRLRLRTENLEGQTYLEMWCSFRGKGELFSRALQSPLSGSQDVEQNRDERSVYSRPVPCPEPQRVPPFGEDPAETIALEILPGLPAHGDFVGREFRAIGLEVDLHQSLSAGGDP